MVEDECVVRWGVRRRGDRRRGDKVRGGDMVWASLLPELVPGSASLPEYLVNPRRTCTARVTVVVSCVCVCMYVCPHTLFWQYARLKV